jgi:hypothetical protein
MGIGCGLEEGGRREREGWKGNNGVKNVLCAFNSFTFYLQLSSLVGWSFYKRYLIKLVISAVQGFYVLFYFIYLFWWNWGLNSGTHDC